MREKSAKYNLERCILLQPFKRPLSILIDHEVKKILPSELFNRFEAVVSGSDVTNGKPHPEPYLKALKKLELAPQHAVVVENAPFGIASAKAAKLQCLAIETSATY